MITEVSSLICGLCAGAALAGLILGGHWRSQGYLTGYLAVSITAHLVGTSWKPLRGLDAVYALEAWQVLMLSLMALQATRRATAGPFWRVGLRCLALVAMAGASGPLLALGGWPPDGHWAYRGLIPVDLACLLLIGEAGARGSALDPVAREVLTGMLAVLALQVCGFVWFETAVRVGFFWLWLACGVYCLTMLATARAALR